MSVVITGEDVLRRHIHPTQIYDDGSVSVAAFKTTDMSLDLCRMRTLEESCAAAPGKGMAEFAAKVASDAQLVVEFDPIKDDPRDPDNPAHCVIKGKVREGPAKKLRNAAALTFRPPA